MTIVSMLWLLIAVLVIWLLIGLRIARVTYGMPGFRGILRTLKPEQFAAIWISSLLITLALLAVVLIGGWRAVQAYAESVRPEQYANIWLGLLILELFLFAGLLIGGTVFGIGDLRALLRGLRREHELGLADASEAMSMPENAVAEDDE